MAFQMIYPAKRTSGKRSGSGSRSRSGRGCRRRRRRRCGSRRGSRS